MGGRGLLEAQLRSTSSGHRPFLHSQLAAPTKRFPHFCRPLQSCWCMCVPSAWRPSRSCRLESRASFSSICRYRLPALRAAAALALLCHTDCVVVSIPANQPPQACGDTAGRRGQSASNLLPNLPLLTASRQCMQAHGPLLHLHFMATLPDKQGSGLGRSLLEHLERMADAGWWVGGRAGGLPFGVS